MEKTENMPPWVYWGLWGINSRKVALGFSIFTLIIFLCLIPIGIMIQDYVLIGFIFVPLWYWLAIRWVDKNSSWPKKS